MNKIITILLALAFSTSAFAADTAAHADKKDQAKDHLVDAQNPNADETKEKEEKAK